MPKYKFKRKALTTHEEIASMIKKAKEPWLKAIIAFLYVFGCRISEALAMQKEDVWIERDTLCVNIPLLKRRKTKGPYERPAHILRVKINTPFIDEFIKYWEELPPYKKIFPHSRWWTWKKIKETNKKISPHVFRHDRLTKIAMKKPNPFLLKEWAGWSDTRPAESYVEAVGFLTNELQDIIE